MPVFLLSIVAFLGGWRNLIAAGLLAGAVGTAAYFFYQYDARGNEITALNIQLKQKNHDLLVLKSNVDLANAATAAVNARLKDRDRDLEQLCRVLNEINTDTDPGADGPVGSPVDKALEALKKQEQEKAR